MGTPEVKTCPDGFGYCRGSRCHDIAGCTVAGDCTYKSSAEQFRAASLEQVAFEFIPPVPTVQRSVETAKASNPKDAVGSNKIPFHLWPEVASAYGAIGCLDGMLKYGRSNYRAIGVRSTIYIDACKRHLNAWLEGEECAKDSGVPHLGHALACIAILLDARAAGKLNDDRNVAGGYLEEIEKLTPHVARLKASHADKSPKHYTIQDNQK